MSSSSDALLPALVGLLLGIAVSREHEIGLLHRAPSGFATERESDPDRLCLRDLRRLPGIGPARARAIISARHATGAGGGPESWRAIHGIGAATVRGASEFLEVESAVGAYTSRGSTP